MRKQGSSGGSNASPEQTRELMKKKSSQLSVSISVNNNSMNQAASKIIQKGNEQKNMPIEIARINKELQTQSKKKALIKNKNDSEHGIDATLSISAGQIQLNEREKNAQSPETDKRSSAKIRCTTPEKATSEFQAPTDKLNTENHSKVDEIYTNHDDIQSQLITSAQPLAIQQYEDTQNRFKRGPKNKNGIVVRKKRIKSTRPGGIRGALLIQDKYAVASPVHKKQRVATAQGDQSSGQYMMNQSSTKAGNSITNQQSSMLAQSYAPCGLVKIGARSVQRLKPRVTSSQYMSGRPTTANHQLLGNQQPLQFDQFSARNISSFKTTNKLRAQSHLAQQNKFMSMKAAMVNSSSQQNYGTLGRQKTNDLDEQGLVSMHSDLNKGDIHQLDDGFKLVSQFENEAQAIAYASELQKYYDSLNMDVKVKIEANLDDLNDTEDKRYASESINQQEYQEIESVGDLSAVDIEVDKLKELARVNIKQAFNSHFKKINPVQRRSEKSCTKRGDDLTEQTFEKPVVKEMPKMLTSRRIEYDKPSRKQIREIRQAQEQIYGVIKHTAKLPELSYKNVDAQERQEAVPNFKFDQDVRRTQIKHNANLQAKILQKLGVMPKELEGEVPHASQVMSNDNKIPKSMAKFYHREQRLKKLFDEQVKQWQQEGTSAGGQASIASAADAENFADVEIRLYRERDDDYCIMGNKLQYRASEENQHQGNYISAQAMKTKDGFDPIRIRLRIMPISRAPLAQGKTPDYYFLEAAKKALGGDLTAAIEQLKRALILNPNHFICRFNHGVLMFKFGLIQEAINDFKQLTVHPHGKKDPWVFYNYATCLIQMGGPSKSLKQQEKDKLAKKRQNQESNTMRNQEQSLMLGLPGILNKQKSMLGRIANVQNKRQSILVEPAMIRDNSQTDQPPQKKKRTDKSFKNQLSLASSYIQKEIMLPADTPNTKIDKIQELTVNQKQDKQRTDNYLTAIAMCSEAIKLGGNDQQIILDALKLKGICWFRLGELRRSVEVLTKHQMMSHNIQQDLEAKRKARIKRNMADDIIGYFQRRDYDAMKKKRSKSFEVTEYKRIRVPKYLRMQRCSSWGCFELEEQKIEKEFELQHVATEDDDEEEEEITTSVEKDEKIVVEDQEESANDKVQQPAIEMMDKSRPVTPDNLKREKGLKITTPSHHPDSPRLRSRLSAQSPLSEKPVRKSTQKDQSGGLTSPAKESAYSQALEALDRKEEELKQALRTEEEKEQAVLKKQLGGRRDKEGSEAARNSENEQEGADVNAEGEEEVNTEDKEQTKEKGIRFQLPPDQKAQVLRTQLMKKLVNRLTKVRREMGHKTALASDGKIDVLMAKLEKQKAELAADRKQLNLSKAQYAIFRRTYIENRKASDEVVDGADPMRRLKNIYLREWAEDEEDYEDCNIIEITELKKRKETVQWLNTDDLVAKLLKEAAQKLKKLGEVGIDPVEELENRRFVERLLEVAAVNEEEVEGSRIDDTLLDIIGDQAQMDGLMSDLRERVAEMCRSFEQELNRGLEELTASVPKLDEMKMLRGERHTGVEDQALGHEDKMITRLRDALNRDDPAPDEVMNVLRTDTYEKEKLKLQLQYMNGGEDDDQTSMNDFFVRRKQIAGDRVNRTEVRQDMRYTERHIEMLKSQLEQKPADRNYKVLDIMMRHLRFIKRHDPEVRQSIYRNAEFIEVPAQTVIFRKGDEADYMYILLKGRISVESNLSQYADIPLILAACKDGEAFGELAVVDQDRIADEGGRVVNTESNETPTRLATCKAVEVSRMLRLGAAEAKRIVQPTLRKEQEYSTMSRQQSKDAISSIESVAASQEGIPSEPKDFIADELNKRLQFLQSFEIFRDLKSKVLVPVALNMALVTFRYGEFLTREGEVPRGMHLIKSGQCIVGLSRTSSRPKNYRDIPGQREPLVDKHRLFHRFDPENSLLNNVEMQDRVFQNGRIYVENGEQIRDKIVYHDFVQFNKLFPKKQFGGRCLLPFELYLQLKRVYFGAAALAKPDNEPILDMKSEEKYQMKSFLDVVADSAVVEAFLITTQGIQYLSDQYLQNIYENIVQEKEPDRPFLEEKITRKRDEMLESQAANLATVKRIMWENKIEKYGVMAVKEHK